MAEQEYQIRNKHMLIVSALLGLVTVVLFLWHDYRIRRENEEDLISVICAGKDLMVGDKLANDNMEIKRIPQSLVPTEFLDDIARARDFNALVNMDVNQEVATGRIIRWSYLAAGPGGPAQGAVPGKGKRLVPIETGRGDCPANLQVGSYVDLMTTLGDGRTLAVMERMLVKAINGVGAVGASSRNIDQVAIEVRDVDVADLLAFKATKAKITLLVRNPDEPATLKNFNPELKKLLRAAGGPRPD